MTTTHSPTATETQRLLIHNRLLTGEWCSCKELERVSGSRRVAARICELRKEGMSIITRLVECENGNHAAEYRHIQERTMPTTPEHQRSMIRNRLLCYQWLEASELERASGGNAVRTRINELRAEGVSIEERNGGTEYRMAPHWTHPDTTLGMGNPSSGPVTESSDSAAPDDGVLF
jgi:hypothetical protein